MGALSPDRYGDQTPGAYAPTRSSSFPVLVRLPIGRCAPAASAHTHRRVSRLRRAEFEARFPGLLDLVLRGD